MLNCSDWPAVPGAALNRPTMAPGPAPILYALPYWSSRLPSTVVVNASWMGGTISHMKVLCALPPSSRSDNPAPRVHVSTELPRTRWVGGHPDISCWPSYSGTVVTAAVTSHCASTAKFRICTTLFGPT